MAFPAFTKLLRQKPLLFSLAPLSIVAAVHSFSSSAKPPSPDRIVGAEHWSAPYRRRLGIGDSPLQLAHHMRPWIPPAQGELKIDFSISLPEPDDDDQVHGGIGVWARNSSGDLLGLAWGRKEIPSKLGMQLYALKTAANLGRLIKEGGYHEGPVVYETKAVLVFCCFAEDCEGDPDGVLLEDFMPDDLESVAHCCQYHFGRPERMVEVLARHHPGLEDILREDKILAGLA